LRLGLGFIDMRNPITEYVAFWNAYCSICKNNGLSLAPFTFPFKHRNENKKLEIYLNEPIHLKEWPQNSASKKMPVDILVDGIETIDPANNNIIKSNVSVNYFDTSKKSDKILVPMESIHYDYEEPCCVGHPVFHAQLSTTLTKNMKRSESFSRYEVKDDCLEARLKGIRIPTAHMGLISVLISLLADHSRREKKDKDVTYIPALQAILVEIRKRDNPLVCCNSLQIKMKGKDASSFQGILWYPEYA
jgi:hypothetical protein